MSETPLTDAEETDGMKLTLASIALAALILLAHGMAYQDEVNMEAYVKWHREALDPND